MFSDILLTTDIDRTLTATDGSFPERNTEAIRYFMENGGTFTVNTGRSTNTIKPLLPHITVNAPMLLYNGSAAWHDGKFCQNYPIDCDMWEMVLSVAEAFPELNVEIQALDTHYLVNQKASYMDFCDAQGWGHAPAVPGTDLGPFIKFAVFGQIHNNALGHLFAATEEEMARMQELGKFILDRWGDKVDIFYASPRILDVHAKGVSKLRAARDLQKQLGKKILICVGDADNDVPMLRGADYAYCPADGVVADRFETVCPCSEGAVADVIYKKIPGILQFQP